MRKEPIIEKSAVIIIAMLLLLAAFGCTDNKSAEPVSEKQDAMEEQGRPVSPTQTTESELQSGDIRADEEEEEPETTSATTGSIAGRIYMDDRLLAMATIQVENSGHRIVTRVRADVTGRYTISDLAPGSYNLRYIKSTGAAYGIGRQVRVRAGETTEYDMRLTSYE